MKFQMSLNDMHHQNKCESNTHKRETFKHDRVTFESHPLCYVICKFHSGMNLLIGGGDNITF